MKTDMTLLEKDGAPTIAELKAFFGDHDFSTQVSKYDPMTAPEEQNKVYIKAKKYFLSSWNKQMKLLTGKGSLINFTSNAPVRCLEEANENLVAGAVMEILSDETLCECIIDSMLTALEGDITAEIKKYAKAHNKTVEELTEEELALVFDQFADLFLSVMMNKLMQVESVPEIMGVSKEIGAHEDFANTANTNFDKIDFKRQRDHTRSRVGEMESLDQIEKTEHTAPEAATEFTEEDPQAHLEMVETIKEFYTFLGDETDIKIFKLKADGYTQKQIAELLGFKTHSAVGKRLRKIEEKRLEFLKTRR
ncbi:MAG: winged helix-turn-helix transcriptional regulator [Clostridia bacterium]|nr:winged helix-turn-helix transcriptional regulator [Clostridia bacterium]